MDIEKLKRKQSRLLDIDAYAVLFIPIVAGIILILIILTAVFTWTSAITIFTIILFVVVFFGLCVFRTIMSHKLKKLNQQLLDYENEDERMYRGKYLTKSCQLCGNEYTWKYSEPDIVSGIALPGFDDNNFAHTEYIQVCHDCLHNIGKIIFDRYRGKLCGS